MADKATILQNAQRYMAKGQLDKAIDEWQKLISESPNDGNIYNTIGDLLQKKNDLPQAVEAYLKGAEVFHTAGFALKTIAIYKKLIKLLPQRLDILIKLGDLNAERGLTGNAVEDYLTAAKQYAQDGYVREALEVYRKIANLDPTNTAIRLKLAEMCLKEGLKKEAVDEFIKVAEFYQENNRAVDADSLYKRILEFDPDNETVRKKKGMPDLPPKQPSKEEMLSQIDGLIEKGRIDEAQNLLGRLTELDPDDPVGHCKRGMVFLKTGNKEEAFASLQAAVHRYMGRNEYGQAGKLMKDYLEADPDRTDAYRLLAEAYERGGNPRLAVSAYAHVIDDYLALGETAPAKELYVKIKALEPEHRDVRRLRHALEPLEVSQPSIVPPQTDRPLETPVRPAEPSMPNLAEVSAEAGSEPAPAPSEPMVFADPAVLSSLFTEAEVYLKYGLVNKAVGQLEQILAMDPENIAAHQQLKEIYKTDGQTEKAVEVCFRLMEIYKKTGNVDDRESLLEEARRLDPENPRLREATDLAPILESGRMKAILAEEPVESEPVQPSPQKGREAPAMIVPEAVPLEVSALPLQEKDDVTEQMAEADFYYQEGLRDEAKKIYELILALRPDHAPARERLGAIEAEEARKAVKATPAESVPRASRPLPKPKEDAPAGTEITPPKPSKEALSEEQALEKELDESFASFMSAGADEPLETAKSAGRPIPRDAREEKIARDSTDRPEEFVDLSGILSEEARKDDARRVVPGDALEEKTIDEELDNIFSEFQKDAKEQSDSTDAETHYNLGIAYKEMGLFNEAVLEFELALKEPDRFIDASSMLAACHQQTGNLQAAADLLERALSDPRCNDAQGRWLRYELASLHERDGRPEEALALFNEILQSDRNFKDVTERVEALQVVLGKSRRGKQASKTVPDDSDDVNDMMDKIFEEASSATKVKEEIKRKDRISYL